MIPVFNEEESLPPLHERIHIALDESPFSYEVVYVDDGSTDGTAAAIRELHAGDDHVRFVRFRRNFGQTAALQAGIDHSRGSILVFMDGDLQNDPDDILLLVKHLDDGFDVVSGWRQDRKDVWLWRRLPSRTANWLISRVTGVHLKDYGCTLKAYRREILENVKLYGEMHRFIPAIASWSGATVVEVPVRHHPRVYGRSKYGISRTVRVLLDLMTVKFLGSYSTKPIYVFGLAGVLSGILAFLSGATVILQRLLPPHHRATENPLFLVTVFMGLIGTLFIMMGLLAEIMIRTYHESQDKRTYTVSEIGDRAAAGPGPPDPDWRSSEPPEDQAS